MEVVRAKHAGFCFGVRRAIEAAERVAREGGGVPVRTDGPRIHNAREVARLAALGVTACADPAALDAACADLTGADSALRVGIDHAAAIGLGTTDYVCERI